MPTSLNGSINGIELEVLIPNIAHIRKFYTYQSNSSQGRAQACTSIEINDYTLANINYFSTLAITPNFAPQIPALSFYFSIRNISTHCN